MEAKLLSDSMVQKDYFLRSEKNKLALQEALRGMSPGRMVILGNQNGKTDVIAAKADDIARLNVLA